MHHLLPDKESQKPFARLEIVCLRLKQSQAAATGL